MRFWRAREGGSRGLGDAAGLRERYRGMRSGRLGFFVWPVTSEEFPKGDGCQAWGRRWAAVC